MVDGMIRIGKVSSVDENNCTARVLFEDRDNVVSYDFPIIVPATLKDKYYCLPQLGERVLCILQPNTPSKSFILGSYYCDKRKPPYKNKDKAYVEFEDKTLIEYDKKAHKLKLFIPEFPEAETSVEIECKGKMRVKSEGELTIESGAGITLLAPLINFNEVEYSYVGAIGTKEINDVIVFEVSDEKVLAFQNFVRSNKARYSKHDILQKKPILEFIGADLDSIDLQITLKAELGVNPRSEMDKLIKIQRDGITVSIMIGGSGFGVYRWFITDLNMTWERIDAKGILTSAVCDLTLQEYV